MFNLGSAVASVASEALAAMLCPSCPTALATRDLFFSGDWIANTAGLLGTFVIAIGCAHLVTRRSEGTTP